MLAQRRPLHDAVTHLEGPGFDLLAGRSGSGKLGGMEPGALEGLLSALRTGANDYDAVLVDVGAGLDRTVRRMAAFADTLVVVATDEPTSLTDAYALLKVHTADRAGVDARIMVNLARSQPEGERTFATLHPGCAAALDVEAAARALL